MYKTFFNKSITKKTIYMFSLSLFLLIVAGYFSELELLSNKAFGKEFLEERKYGGAESDISAKIIQYRRFCFGLVGR